MSNASTLLPFGTSSLNDSINGLRFTTENTRRTSPNASSSRRRGCLPLAVEAKIFELCALFFLLFHAFWRDFHRLSTRRIRQNDANFQHSAQTDNGQWRRVGDVPDIWNNTVILGWGCGARRWAWEFAKVCIFLLYFTCFLTVLKDAKQLKLHC